MKTFVITAAMAVALDQWTKYLIKAGIKLYEVIWVIKDVLKITHIENSGIAFGIFGGAAPAWVRWALVGVIACAAAAITLYWAHSNKGSALFNLSCGLILGGALGNLIDRIFIGRITDFIEAGYKNLTWPVFNVADSSVTVGVCLFIIFILTEKREAGDAPGSV
jgi:signal peptidase II